MACESRRRRPWSPRLQHRGTDVPRSPCTVVRTEFGRFAAVVGLHDFLLDTFDVPRTPKEVATLALDQLCAGDKGKNDQIVCLGMLSFLDETLGRPEQDPDRYLRLKDLADLLTSSATPAQLERWVETWYE